MRITEARTGQSVVLGVSGRIDVSSSAILQAEIEKWLPSYVVQNLVIEMSQVEYISSAGIRVLLSAQKKIGEKRMLIIKNPSPFCKQVFDVTGADIFLKIEY